MITTNTLTNKSFLLSYIPYQLDAGTLPAYTIQDMVSYNLQPGTSPSRINYFIGAANNYTEILTIKNITTNAVLDVEVTIDGNQTAWNIEASKQKVTLGPSDMHTIQFALNRPVLSTISDRQILQSSIVLTIKNRSQNFVTKLTATPLIGSKILPNTVDVT
jgi:hypothetical protein